MNWTIATIPIIEWLTEEVLRGIGVRRLTLEITPEIDRILRGMGDFDIENYIASRIKEHISAHIFAILVQDTSTGEITISTTSLTQDIKNWQDVRLRWLYGNPDLVYADMTGGLESYERKKERKRSISSNENKILIYVPWTITEYCYKSLLWNKINGTLKENISTIIGQYREHMKPNRSIKIKTYDLRKHDEKTYQFR